MNGILEPPHAPSWIGEPHLAERDVHVWILGSCAAVGGRAPCRPVSSHALLRSLLGAYLRADPDSLRFERGEHGKPRLAVAGAAAAPGASGAGELHFNMSHSGGLTAVAVSRGGAVGVDVELAGRRERDHVALARRAWGEEVAARLEGLDRAGREREFLRLWVRWEAALKCGGGGVGGRPPRDGTRPWVIELDLGERAVGALAGASRPGAVRLARVREAGDGAAEWGSATPDHDAARA